MTPEDEELVAGELDRFRLEPLAFFEEVLRVRTLWRKQAEILEALRDHRLVAVPSCHDSGKTFLGGGIPWWWVATEQPSKVLTISTGGRQVKAQTWAEIRTRYANMDPEWRDELLRLPPPNDTEWKLDDECFMLGLTTNPDRQAETATRLQGYKSPHLLIHLDEAGGIEEAIWNALDSLLIQPGSKLLATGNPSNPTGGFAKFCRRPDVKVVPISAFDCPNLQPGAKQLTWGPTRESVEMIRLKYGEDSPVYQFRILGRFPTSSVDTLISIAILEAAFQRQPPPRPTREQDRVPSLGVDVARFGTDRSTYVGIDGPAVLLLESRSGEDTMQTAGRTIATAERLGITKGQAERIAVDDTGVGGGVVDRCRELGWRVQAVNFGEKPRDEREGNERFVNRRTELWWHLRTWITNTAALADVRARDPAMADDLIADLTTPKYAYRSDQTIELESKDKIRKRLGRSPDLGDGLALAVAGQNPRRSVLGALRGILGRRGERSGEADRPREGYARPQGVAEELEGILPSRDERYEGF